PPMMAQGGIVGYNKGDVVISDERLKELGMTRAQFDALPAGTKAALAPKPYFTSPTSADRREEAQKRLAQQKVDRRAEKEEEKRKMNEGLAARRREQARAEAEAAGLQIADPVGTIGPEEMAEMDLASAAQGKKDPNTFTVDQARQYVRDQYNQMAANDTDTDTDTDAPQGGPQVGGGPQAGTDLAGMLKDKLNTGVTEEQKATIGQNQASDRLDSGIKTTLDSMSKGADPQSAMKTAQAQGDARYNQDYSADDLKIKRQATDDELRRQLTPEALKEQRLRAGAVQRGGLAGA
ncbi:MAG: hypothetical protein ACPGGM_05890, partial [Porticoccaceae bacterium]